MKFKRKDKKSSKTIYWKRKKGENLAVNPSNCAERTHLVENIKLFFTCCIILRGAGKNSVKM